MGMLVGVGSQLLCATCPACVTTVQCFFFIELFSLLKYDTQNVFDYVSESRMCHVNLLKPYHVEVSVPTSHQSLSCPEVMKCLSKCSLGQATVMYLGKPVTCLLWWHTTG